MPNNIYKPKHFAAELAELQARTRDVMNKAREALRLPPPDTFLGRRHDDLTPMPDFDQECSACDKETSTKYGNGSSGLLEVGRSNNRDGPADGPAE